MLYNTLSQLKAKNLGAGKHADGQGLWLVKRDKQLGKWTLRLMIGGKRREMGLGRYPDVSIAEARDRAADARKALRDGIDPITERKKARYQIATLSVKEAILGCFEAKKAELKGDGEAGRWLSPLSVHIIPKLGSLPIEALDQHVLVEVLKPIWHEKSEAASKALNRINLTLKHAAALGLEVDLQTPMKVKALLGKQRHETVHIPSLPYGEMPLFYQKLHGMENVAALALRFLILTVARTSEVRLATFDEIEGDTWLLPAIRTKTNQERRIPLTHEAQSLVALSRQGNDTNFLFPSHKGNPLSDAGMAALMKREGLAARPHGFRATFRTWVEEQTDTPFEVKESALGHSVDSEVVRAYQRSDRFERRRVLMEAWEGYLLRSIN